MDEGVPILTPVEALQQVLDDCEEFGEAILYFQKQDGYYTVSTVDPSTVKEVLDPYSKKLMGFTQTPVKGLPKIYFSVTEMLKLKRVR
jgi:hypothetical protein